MRPLILLLAMSCLQCSPETPATAAAGDTATDVEEGEADGGGPDTKDAGPPPECYSHSDCGLLFCDPGPGECIECLLHAHCPEDAPWCHAGFCDVAGDCSFDSPDCAEGICDTSTTACVDCLDDQDCAADEVCLATICKSPPPPCEVAADCEAHAMTCDLSSHHCVDCLDHGDCSEETHCNTEGICAPDLCPAGAVDLECAGQALSVCTDDGSQWIQTPCPEGESCQKGAPGISETACAPIVCDAGIQECLDFHTVSMCNATGTAETTYPCPASTVCEWGSCSIPRPVVLVVFDTSSSMWAYPDGGVPELCEPLGKPCVAPWPECEANTGGLTLMARSKLAFSALFESFANKVHFGLLRFPQRTAPQSPPQCKSGHHLGMSTLTADPSERATSLDDHAGWFPTNLAESVVVPVSSTDIDNLPEIQTWFDFSESLSPPGAACDASIPCPEAGACVQGACTTHADPELRAAGQTPLGRTLFYAGEYLRHRVAVDGRACANASDCATPFHACVEGVCEDPGRICRPFVIIVFTDGSESVDKPLDNWFNPRNQAHRFQFGLGCTTDEDCLSSASCVEGACAAPGAPPGGKSCQSSGSFCQQDADCGEAGLCVSNALNYIDPEGTQQLVAGDGTPIVVSVHVVTVGSKAAEASLIAAHGGGTFAQITDADHAALVDALSSIVSAKLAAECLE